MKILGRRFLLALAVLLTPFSLVALITGEPGGILDTTSNVAASIFLAIGFIGPTCAALWLWFLNTARARAASWMVLVLIGLSIGLQGLHIIAGTFGPKFPVGNQWISKERGLKINDTYVQMAYGPKCIICAGGELWLLQTRKVLPGLVMEKTIGPNLVKPELFYASGPSAVMLNTDDGPRSFAVKPYIFFGSFKFTSSGLNLSDCDSVYSWTPLLQMAVSRIFCAPMK
jgi:hypothetical protein